MCRIPNISDLEAICERNDLMTHLMDHPGDWTPVIADWLLHLVTRGLGKRVEMLCYKPQTSYQVAQNTLIRTSSGCNSYYPILLILWRVLGLNSSSTYNHSHFLDFQPSPPWTPHYSVLCSYGTLSPRMKKPILKTLLSNVFKLGWLTSTWKSN